ncbi:MAG TPA: hypothetical protein VFY56_16040, partial [Propionibacteriaceae bacterium]|nr:hypothetical protein [Propionibacteriaceae bacterium]
LTRCATGSFHRTRLPVSSPRSDPLIAISAMPCSAGTGRAPPGLIGAHVVARYPLIDQIGYVVVLVIARVPPIDRIGYVVVLVIAEVPPIDQVGYVLAHVIANAPIIASVARGTADRD